MMGLFAVAGLILWWCVVGYVFYLGRLGGTYRPRSGEMNDEQLPYFSVVVPCYNEEELIGEKVADLAAADYPMEKLSVYFAHGRSTDRTAEIIRESIQDHPNFFLVETGRKGKIPQVNAVLETLETDIIFISDVDSEIEPDAFRKVGTLFLLNPDLGVVGARVTPRGSTPEEEIHWHLQNQLRRLESGVGMSSVVIANAYAFRRSVLSTFDNDVIADDVHVTFRARRQGWHSLYAHNIVAADTRSASRTCEMLRHKYRKGNANMRELLRFLPVPLKDWPWPVIFYTKFLQTFLLPLSIIGFLLSSLSLAPTHGLWVAAFWLGLAITWVRQQRHLTSGKEDDASVSSFTAIKAFCLVNIVLLADLITYPFYRQSSRYSRLSAPGGRGSA